MKKTFLNVKIITIVQFVLCLIFAFAFWISVKYTDTYPNDNKAPSNDQTSAEVCEIVDSIEV